MATVQKPTPASVLPPTGEATTTPKTSVLPTTEGTTTTQKKWEKFSTDWGWTKPIWNLPLPWKASPEEKTVPYWIKTAVKLAVIPFLLAAAVEGLAKLAVMVINGGISLANRVVEWIHAPTAKKIETSPAVEEEVEKPEAPVTPEIEKETEEVDADDEGSTNDSSKPSEDTASVLNISDAGSGPEDLGESEEEQSAPPVVQSSYFNVSRFFGKSEE